MRIAGLGGFEWLIILLVVIMIFGTGKLAGIGPALGKSIRGFREELHTNDKAKETKNDAADGNTQAAAKPPAQQSEDNKTGWF